jgi:predicted TIM-barrel fold metal-dependent hydrolase
MVAEAKVQVIDADAHVIETAHTWDFLEPGEEKYRPLLYTSAGNQKQDFWVIGGKVRGFRFPTLTEQQITEASRVFGTNMATPQEAREMDDVGLRLKHMDELGIDVQVLHNTLWIERITDQPAAEIALCRSWNRWMAEIWKQAAGRLLWVCVVPLMSIDESIEQVREAREQGAVGICIRPLEGDRFITDPYFFPLYEEAKRLNMPIIIHIANGNPTNCDLFRDPGAGDNFGGFKPGGLFGMFRAPTVMSCNMLLSSDLPRRFPGLRWGFIEADAQWVPWVIHETRRRKQRTANPLPDNPMKEFGIFVTCETDDDLPYIIEKAGEDCMVVGTDYGHSDPTSDVDAIAKLREREDISPIAFRKIISDNPRALYGL